MDHLPRLYSTKAYGEETPDPIITTAALGEEFEATTQRVGEETPTDGIPGAEEPFYTTEAVGEEGPDLSGLTVDNPFGGF